MRIVLLTTVLTLVTASPALAQRPNQPGQAETQSKTLNKAKAEVLRAADAFYAAFRANDVATVENMTAEDYLQTDVNGKVQGKKEWLDEYYLPMVAAIKAGTLRSDALERSEMQVRINGNTAVLIGRTRLAYNGAPPRDLRFTQVWVKRGGKWLRSVFHNAWLPEPRS